MEKKINPKILSLLREAGVSPSNGVPYLICLHYEYDPVWTPLSLKELIDSSGIYSRKAAKIIWNYPLFEVSSTPFDWVKEEYVPLFAVAGKDKNGKESVTRMKKLFSENPDIRKEEVLEATKLYLYNTDPRFVRLPHYFISKGSGIDRIQDILDWIIKYRSVTDSQERDESRLLQ